MDNVYRYVLTQGHRTVPSLCQLLYRMQTQLLAVVIPPCIHLFVWVKTDSASTVCLGQGGVMTRSKVFIGSHIAWSVASSTSSTTENCAVQHAEKLAWPYMKDRNLWAVGHHTLPEHKIGSMTECEHAPSGPRLFFGQMGHPTAARTAFLPCNLMRQAPAVHASVYQTVFSPRRCTRQLRGDSPAGMGIWRGKPMDAPVRREVPPPRYQECSSKSSPEGVRWVP